MAGGNCGRGALRACLRRLLHLLVFGEQRLREIGLAGGLIGAGELITQAAVFVLGQSRLQMRDGFGVLAELGEGAAQRGVDIRRFRIAGGSGLQVRQRFLDLLSRLSVVSQP